MKTENWFRDGQAHHAGLRRFEDPAPTRVVIFQR
jgi:hypothetical protein